MSTAQYDALNLDFAFGYLEDEHETLLALAIVLLNRLEPRDPSDPDSCLDITSWRLAQVLNDRLADVGFLKRMHGLMLGSSSKSA